MAEGGTIGNDGGHEGTYEGDGAEPPRRRRWPWVLGGVAAVLIAAGAIAASRLDAWIGNTVARELPEISRTLGRPLRVGSVRVSLLSGLAVEVRDVELGPDPAAAAGSVPPALVLPRARVGVSLWSTLLTAGKRPRLREVTVEGLAVHATKHADGRLDWQDMADRWNAAHPPKPDEPMDEDTAERVRRTRLGRLRVNVARVGFSDLTDPAQKAEIRDVTITADDVGLDRSFVVAIGASLLGPSKNFDLRAAFVPAPEQSGTLIAPPLTKLDVRLARTELAPLAPFLAAAPPAESSAPSPDLQRGAIELTIAAEPGAAMEGGTGPTKAAVNAVLAGAQLVGGEPFDARLVVDATGDAAAGDVQIRTFTASLADMSLEARGSLHALRTAPRFDGFVVTSKGLDFDRLQRISPSPTSAVRLAGPFSLNAQAGGDAGAQRFEAQLDLTPSSIVVPDSFAKPPGTPLVITAKGSAEADTVRLEPLTVVIADWRLAMRGVVSQLSQKEPAFDLKIQTDSPGIAGLARLLPPVAKSIPPGRPIAGRIAVDAIVQGHASDLTAKADVSLSDLAVRAPDTRFSGRGTIHAQATKKGQVMDAKVAVDLGALEAVYQDVVRKPAGAPLMLDGSVTQRGTHTTAQGSLRMTGLRASGRAKIDGDGEATPHRFEGQMDVAELGLRSLMAMLPSASKGQTIPDAKLTAQLSGRGVVGRPESIHIEVAKLILTAGRSDMSATATIDNPTRPRVLFDARSRYLDLDELLPERSKKAAGRNKKAPKPDPDSPLVKATGQVKLAILRGRVSRIDFQDLRADLQLVGGRLLARTLEVGAFGGRFTGTGTELPLAEPDGPFTMKGKVTDLDIDAVIARFGDGRDLLRGKLSADIDLSGEGTEPIDVQQTLTGLLGGKLVDAEFVPADLLASIAGPLGKAVSVPGFAALLGGAGSMKADKLQRLDGRQLRDLVGAAQLSNGAVELTKPLAANTPSGPLSLTGRVLLEGRADLKGQLTLSPSVATALTGGKVHIDSPVPVMLSVTGPLRRPTITPTNLDALAKTFAKAYLASEAGKALQGKLGKGAEALLNKTGLGSKLPGGATGTLADPGEAARKAQEDARATADAAAREQTARAQAEAEAARKRAEDEARARAEKVKQGAAGKLRGVLGK